MAERSTPKYDALIGTEVVLRTREVVMEKVTEVFPAGTITDAGTVTSVELPLVSATVAPVAGAAEVSVTVPVALVPPVMAVGDTESDAKAAAAAG
ncbi:MAG TPA: hypothetical protein VMV45_17005, partial [Casimicrobiaceae bacterium]|nr:hypothetical protein [Casimicrobiaceae bacterium]